MMIKDLTRFTSMLQHHNKTARYVFLSVCLPGDEPPAAAVAAAAAASSPAAVPSGGGLLQPLTGFSNGPSLEAAGQPTITVSILVLV